MTYILFDTMLYRTIGTALKNATELQKAAFKQAFFQAEKAQLFQPKLSILVVLELLKHLKNRNDAAYPICKEGLVFALEHASNNYVHPPESHFSNLFFSKIPPFYGDFLNKLMPVLNEIAEKQGADSVIKTLTPEIKALTGKFFDIVDKNFPINKTTTLAPVSKKTKKINLNLPLWEKELDYTRQATLFLTKIQNTLALEKSENFEDLTTYLTQNHRATFEKLRIFTLKMQNNDIVPHKQANEIADALIMMGLSPTENTKFVTAEKANIKIINKVGLKDWVILQDTYFKKLNLENSLLPRF